MVDVTVEERIFFVAVARFLDVRPERERTAEGFFIRGYDTNAAVYDFGVGVCDGLRAGVVDKNGFIA